MQAFTRRKLAFLLQGVKFVKKIIWSILTFFLLLTGCSKEVVKVEEVKVETIETIETIIDSMSVEEKIAQMFIVRHPEANSIEIVKRYQPGGYIFFGRDFENSTPELFKEKVDSYNTLSKIPMFMAVDEEGGNVVRISKYKEFRDEPFKSPSELYKDGGLGNIVKDTEEKALLLKKIGINLNFAPVCDISIEQMDYMYHRSIGQNAEITSEYVKSVVKIMDKEKVGNVLKHFPGYGNNKDTHTGMAFDSRPYTEFLNKDYLPFKAGIDAGAGFVLVSHNVVQCIDPVMPASLSIKVNNELRKVLDFNGIIITDDLEMQAIKKYADDKNAVILAVKAGNDMICCTNFEEQYSAVLNAVRSGEITEERINESVRRILKYTMHLGLIGE